MQRFAKDSLSRSASLSRWHDEMVGGKTCRRIVLDGDTKETDGCQARAPPMIRPHSTRSLERVVGEFDPLDFLEECSARFYSNLALARQSRYPTLLI